MVAHWQVATMGMVQVIWLRESTYMAPEVQRTADSHIASGVPKWVDRALGLPFPAWKQLVAQSRPDLGSLSVQLAPAGISAPAWGRLREHAATAAGVVLAVSLAIALGLRRTLAGLAALATAARRFNASGGTPTKLLPELRHGPRELLALLSRHQRT